MIDHRQRLENRLCSTGVYVQDEWKVTNQLTINAGLRFDQMWQFVDANQLSPRINASPRSPIDGHHLPCRLCALLHAAGAGAGGADQYRAGSTAPRRSPAGHAERSGAAGTLATYYDAGVDQKIVRMRIRGRLLELDLGVDAYYKIATDLLDNGQFGQAYVLSAFNYARGQNDGVEFKANYTSGNFQALRQRRLWPSSARPRSVSNQYLFDNHAADDLGGLTEFSTPDALCLYRPHPVRTDSAVRLQFCGRPATCERWRNGHRGAELLSADMIYGSGLRDGDANIGTVPSYTQVNVGVSHEFNCVSSDPKPTTLRFDVVNLFDTIYEIRDGSGIGVFAPQFGPRRGFYFGISQKL